MFLLRECPQASYAQKAWIFKSQYNNTLTLWILALNPSSGPARSKATTPRSPKRHDSLDSMRESSADWLRMAQTIKRTRIGNASSARSRPWHAADLCWIQVRTGDYLDSKPSSTCSHLRPLFVWSNGQNLISRYLTPSLLASSATSYTTRDTASVHRYTMVNTLWRRIISLRPKVCMTARVYLNALRKSTREAHSGLIWTKLLIWSAERSLISSMF